MRRPSAILALCLLAVSGLLLFAVWRMGLFSADRACQACGRELHPETVTLAQVDGQKAAYCCPTCALNARQQTGEPTQITAFTAYDTGVVLAPQAAYLVVGSELNLCSDRHVHMGIDKHPAQMRFDRCSPSIIAVSSPEAAQHIMQRFGGDLRLYDELAEAYLR